MIPIVWFNGSLRPLEEASVSPLSAGLLYGWGVFTTLGVAEGRAGHVARHWSRLTAHAGRLGVPIEFALDDVEAGLSELITAGGIVSGRARITVARGAAGPWRDEMARPSDLWMLAAALDVAPRPPLNITVSPHRMNSASPLAGVKSTAYVTQLLILEEAKRRGFDDAIVLNERGEVVETSSANIFWVRDGELWTPSLGTGCLAGITRALVLEAASRLRIRAVEGAASMHALHEAHEVFLTNSTRGVQPVAELDIHRFAAPGPLTSRLSAAVESMS